MNARDLTLTAIRAVRRARLRSVLTVLALSVGAFTLTSTTALGAGVSDYVQKQVSALGAGDVLVVTKTASQSTGGGPQRYEPGTTGTATAAGGAGLPGAGGTAAALSSADIDTIRGISGVRSVQPLQSPALDFIRANGESYRVSLSPTASFGRADLAAGKQLNDGSDLQLMLPDEYVEPLGFSSPAAAVGSKVDLGLTDAVGRQRTVEATVVGVSRATLLSGGAGANTALVDRLAEVQQTGRVSSDPTYAVGVARLAHGGDSATVDRVKAALDADGLSGQTVRDQLGVIQTVISGIVGVLDAFAAVALIAAAFGIVNTLLMSVQDRTREIGLMKSMGMARRRIFALFSLEAVTIGLLGSIVGAVVAIALGTALSGALTAGPLEQLPGLQLLLFQPTSVLGVVLLITVIAFLAGTLPARRAAAKNPIEALRYE